MLCHSDEMNFSCTHCGYKCKRKQTLNQHVRAMHTGKPYRKRHEESLASFFNDLQIAFTREYVVKVPTFGNRKFARVDFFIPMSWGVIFFECDEFGEQFTK